MLDSQIPLKPDSLEARSARVTQFWPVRQNGKSTGGGDVGGGLILGYDFCFYLLGKGQKNYRDANIFL